MKLLTTGCTLLKKRFRLKWFHVNFVRLLGTSFSQDISRQIPKKLLRKCRFE